jgi:LysR family hydrogen peroxide-inducible transcriptional activator
VCDISGATELGDFRASSLTTLLQMVAGGLGVTLIPQLSVKAEAASGRGLKVIPFGARGPGRTIGLAWRPSSIRKEEFRLLGAAIKKGLGRP